MGEGKHGLQEQFIDSPYNLPVHETKVQYSGALGLNKLHGEPQNSLGESPILPIPNENTGIY